MSALELALFRTDARGSELAFQFSAPAICIEGGVCSTHPTFGLPAPRGELTGRFTYDPASPANYPIARDDVECLGYWQHSPGGFSATFDNITVSADQYVVQLYDDVPQPGGDVADVVTIIYSSDLSPAPTSPLVVNGTPYFVGQFMVSFLQYGGAQFDAPNLSELSGLENFGRAFAFLGDAGHKTAPADVGVAIESLQAEPNVGPDLDGDLDVDGNDFLTWQCSLGQFDGGDAATLSMWKQQFQGAVAEAAIVPEPRLAPLAALIMLLGTLPRRPGRAMPS